MLNLISQYVSPYLSIITIEDVLEMKLQHPFVRRFLAKPANYEGKGGFSIKDCVRLMANSLRTSLSYFHAFSADIGEFGFIRAKNELGTAWLSQNTQIYELK
jgi:hypothetical protein